MAIIAGIDEAGFGPVLGPMVVSCATFDIPDDLVDASMWRLLSACVCRKPAKRAGRIAINDSKVLYGGHRSAAGLLHLERGVLAMLGSGGRSPASLDELLGLVCPVSLQQMGSYPWFAGATLKLPVASEAMAIRLLANALSAQMSRCGLSVRQLRAEALQVGEYNRLVAATDNKSQVLLDVTCRLLAWLWQQGGGEMLKVFVDHQGGRVYYLPALQRVFEGCRFKVIEESERLSAYRMTDGRRCAEVSFMVGCEQRQLPVALASMTAKYLRELFMSLFNRFWIGHLPAIAPTAGYYGDGNRFYQEIQPLMRDIGVEEALVYRSR